MIKMMGMIKMIKMIKMINLEYILKENIMVILKMNKEKEKEQCIIIMEIFMKGIGKMIV